MRHMISAGTKWFRKVKMHTQTAYDDANTKIFLWFFVVLYSINS